MRKRPAPGEPAVQRAARLTSPKPAPWLRRSFSRMLKSSQPAELADPSGSADPAHLAHPACPTLTWRAASLADAPDLLALMRAFYAEEALVFDGPTQGRALDALLAEPALGTVFLLEAAGPPEASTRAGLPSGSVGPFGHLVLTRGHSLEFGGAFFLLDELYLAPAVRGHGEGRRALAFAAASARASGAAVLRLEVSRKNARARALYERAGFVAEDRDFLTWRLEASDVYPVFHDASSRAFADE